MKKIIVDSFEEFVKKFSNQDLDVVSELFSSVKIAIAKNNDAIHKRDSILLAKALWINKSFYYDSIIVKIIFA